MVYGEKVTVSALSLLAQDASLIAGLDLQMAEAYAHAADGMACRVGCTECCVGPFAITALDALRLRRGLRRLDDEDAPRSRRVRERAVAAVGRLERDFPGDARRGWIGEDAEAAERFETQHGGEVCPALDPVSGACDLYPERPISCRTFGPPVHIGVEDLPPCRLCLVGAPRERLDACRVEPDREGQEVALLASGEAGGLTARETYVAFALTQWDLGGWTADD